MRRVAAIAFALSALASPALAGECTNPKALGTSRTLVIDNTSHPKLGAQQYNETLPLADHEVVLTFDDGPLGPYTTRILDLLAAECVKATYFLVGTMAKADPALVKRIQREGHTIGTHSLAHPLAMERLPLPEMERQIDSGISLVQAALGDQNKLAPFFRIPGLARSNTLEGLLAQRQLVTWSVDLVADDWFRHITADEIAKRALRRIEARGRGILLLHDIHPATALAMPTILKGLKDRGYRIVHVVPAGPGQPKTATEPQYWASRGGKRPRTVVADAAAVIDPLRPVPSRASMDVGAISIAAFLPPPTERHVMAVAGEDFRLPNRGAWSNHDQPTIPVKMASPAPGSEAIDWPQHERVAALYETGDAKWPVVKPVIAAEQPKKDTNKKKTAPATTGKQHVRSSTTACKERPGANNLGALCKKPPGGHQLSLTGTLPPDRLRSQYSF